MTKTNSTEYWTKFNKNFSRACKIARSAGRTHASGDRDHAGWLYAMALRATPATSTGKRVLAESFFMGANS